MEPLQARDHNMNVGDTLVEYAGLEGDRGRAANQRVSKPRTGSCHLLQRKPRDLQSEPYSSEPNQIPYPRFGEKAFLQQRGTRTNCPPILTILHNLLET